ncbi:MAG: FliM/FliN family flagellar motor switch protein [Proteobacteria bacterium]|nr:FliM/FliN family flagellar motor switch protein [Pseudomonadota bacterium]
MTDPDTPLIETAAAAAATNPGDDPGEAPLLEQRDNSQDGKYRRAIFSVPIDVVVSVGHARPVIGELLAMRRDMVLPLSSRMDDPVEILVGDRVIARGELEELGDDSGRLGVRLTEVVDVSDLF